MLTQLQKYVDTGANDEIKNTAKVLMLEFNRLNIQKCPYCDGHGHSGNDCPTDHKLTALRMGTKEQKQTLQAIRKTCRAEAGMASKSGFSQLSTSNKFMVSKKRKRPDWQESGGIDNGFSRKKLKA